MTTTLTLRHGDCLHVLADMPEGSVGAVVSDPPYELSFMCKDWDNTGIAYSPVLWAHLYRVIVPGGVIKAFSATRTFHKMARAMQEAGFIDLHLEAWGYSTGFPKSLDVSKAIDKLDRIGPMQARARAFTAWMRSTGITAQQVNEATGTFMGSHYLTDKSQPAVATADLFDLLRPHLPPVPVEIEELVRSRTVESENMKRRAVVGEYQKVSPAACWRSGATNYGDRGTVFGLITAPHTDAARTWNGWGTALKPSWEPVIVGKKPLTG
jgi:hypothetical protein